MSKIAVDIDDTLYSFEDAAREECIRRGTPAHLNVAYHAWGDWRTPPDFLGVEEWMDVIEAVHHHETILEQQPYLHAADVLWDLVSWGHTLSYISSRDTSTERATRAWLRDCGFPIDGDGAEYLVTGYADKLAYLHDHDVLIDDRPKTLVTWVYQYGLHSARQGFALAKDLNRNLTDVPRIYVSPTWEGLRSGLVKKGFLDERE